MLQPILVVDKYSVAEHDEFADYPHLLRNNCPDLISREIKLHKLPPAGICVADSEKTPMFQNGTIWKAAIRGHTIPDLRLIASSDPEIDNELPIELVYVQRTKMDLIGS
jgi:hypothetical protein